MRSNNRQKSVNDLKPKQLPAVAANGTTKNELIQPYAGPVARWCDFVAHDKIVIVSLFITMSLHIAAWVGLNSDRNISFTSLSCGISIFLAFYSFASAYNHYHYQHSKVPPTYASISQSDEREPTADETKAATAVFQQNDYDRVTYNRTHCYKWLMFALVALLYTIILTDTIFLSYADSDTLLVSSRRPDTMRNIENACIWTYVGTLGLIVQWYSRRS